MAEEIFLESTTCRVPARVWTRAVEEYAIFHGVSRDDVTKAEAVNWAAGLGIHHAAEQRRNDAAKRLRVQLTERASDNEHTQRS